MHFKDDEGADGGAPLDMVQGLAAQEGHRIVAWELGHSERHLQLDACTVTLPVGDDRAVQ